VLDGCLVNGYGSLTALGWAKSFSATNKAVYRAPNGIRHYLDVDDSAPDATALGRNARIRGYEAATAVGTGTGPFPTTAQATQAVVVKSTTADGTSRPWILVGDDKTFYLFTAGAGTTPPVLATIQWTGGWGFGELLSVLTGDSYRSILFFMTTTSTSSTDVNNVASFMSASATTAFQMNMPRSYSGAGGSIWASPVNHQFTTMPYPNAPDGGLYMNAMLIAERGNGSTPAAQASSPGFRGRLRGFYGTAHALTPFADQDSFSGVGDFAGRTFIVLRVAGSATM